MKKIKFLANKIYTTMLVGLTGLIFIGCNQNNPQPNNLQWNVNIGGQTYSWQGSYPNNMTGGSALAASNGTSSQPFSISCALNGGTSLAISLPLYNSGSFTLNSSNYATSNLISFMLNGSANGYSTAYGGSVVVNVTQFPSNVNGIIKGTFSGTIGKSPGLGGGTTAITGSFDVLRSN
jgi:hypothetical protein